MIIKIRLGHYRFTFTIASVVDVVGVNSTLPNGNHILMWDFDSTKLGTVIRNLKNIQAIYNLPYIYILETKKHTNYIAYCFKQLLWGKVVEIIASTHGVDENFFKYGVYRRRFTLRVTPKTNIKPKLAHILFSEYPEDCSIKELKSWVKYETLRPDYKSKRWIINEPENT